MLMVDFEVNTAVILYIWVYNVDVRGFVLTVITMPYKKANILFGQK